MRLPPTLDLIRPVNCLLSGIAVLIGAVVAVGHLNVAATVIVSSFLAAALVAGGGNAINDYFDRDIDKVNRPHRPIPSRRMKPKRALITSQLFFISGIALTIFLNIYCLLLAGLNSLVLFLYAWKLKRRGLSGNLAIGYLVGSTFLFGGLATAHIRTGSLVPGGLLFLVLMASLSTVGRELIKAIQDMSGDRKLKFKTFPLRYGAGKAAALAILFIITAIVISPVPYLLGIFSWQYIAVVTISIAAFIAAAAIIARKRDKRATGEASLICKIAMALGLLAFIVGTLY